MDGMRSPIPESGLEAIAAGAEMPEEIRAAYAILFGTGIGAAFCSIWAECQEPGGAKKLVDAIYNGGEDFRPDAST